MKKTVLVTGSSRGIGRAVALNFASCGYRVVINCARSADRMEEVKKEVETLGRVPGGTGGCRKSGRL